MKVLLRENSMCNDSRMEGEQLFSVFKEQQGDRSITQVESEEEEC